MIKDLILALSTANLCFIITWNELLNSPIRRFNSCLAIIINVMLLGAFFWTVVTLARRSGNVLAMRLVRFFFPLVLLLPLDGLIQILFPKKGIIIDLLVLCIAVAIVGLFEIMPWHRWIIRGAEIGVMVLFPFFLISMSQASWPLINPRHVQLAPALSAGNSRAPRLLWLLFDEMDQRVTFADRPAKLELPELDRLRSQALYATNAFPPSDSTQVSVPALITGRLLSNAVLVNESTLMITFANSNKALNWKSERSLFSDARDAGFNTAFIGSCVCIPSCYALGDSLTNCVSVDAEAATLRESMSHDIDRLITTVPLMSGLGIISTKIKWDRRRTLAAYVGVLEAAKQVSANPDVGLTMVHWPVPHPPGIYNRETDDFEVNDERSYLDNLRLVDRTVGELRRAMEESATWDSTIVLLTSDHWLRRYLWRTTGLWNREDADAKTETDHRVPFMLKLAGQRKPVTYDAVFNNVLTHDLILALLRRELSTPESVAVWLDEHRSVGESPYMFNMP